MPEILALKGIGVNLYLTPPDIVVYFGYTANQTNVGKMTMKGWHFCTTNRRLGHGDGRLIEAEKTLAVQKAPELCVNGLHASERAIDALKYAPGSVVSYVELRGAVVRSTDKAVAAERHTYWIADAESVLYEFARWCALQVIHLWDAPDVAKDFLTTGREELKAAARAAAWAAAQEKQNAELERRLHELNPSDYIHNE